MKGNKLPGRISYRLRLPSVISRLLNSKYAFKNIGYAGAAVIVAVERKPNEVSLRPYALKGLTKR